MDLGSSEDAGSLMSILDPLITRWRARRHRRVVRSDLMTTATPVELTPTIAAVTAQLVEHGVELGKRYKDKASGFEGTATALYFFEHGCLRINLRGSSKTTGEPVDASFDAPDLIDGESEKAVPASPTRTGGPHDTAPMARPGPT